MISYAGRRRLTRHRTIGARTFPDGAAAPTAPPAAPPARRLPGGGRSPMPPAPGAADEAEPSGTPAVKVRDVPARARGGGAG
ncbi:hypothetical protein GCM10009735_53060 [Actinomadura chokoriensis]